MARVALALVGAATLVACGEGPERAAPARTDSLAAGAIALPEPARRVASLVPAATDWIVALGAADRLVARTDFDVEPALRNVPSVGGGLDPSVEWLVARRPDLVVAWPDGPARATVRRLEAVGIPVYAAPAETIEDALRVARDLGRMLDREAAADSAVAEVRQGLARLAEQTGDTPPPSVLFLIGLEPLTAAGPGTFVDELIRAAGGANVLDGIGLRWPAVSLEEVARRDPAVLLVGTATPLDAAALRGRPGWRRLTAVREGRVHSVDPDIMNRWGPHLHESAALLARLIHGADAP